MKNNIQTYETRIAEEVGLIEAILYQSILMWVEHNRANGKNYIKDKYWTYNSINAWKELYPYMTEYAIKTALKNLKEKGYIDYEQGLNKNNKWDKTTYYTIIEREEKNNVKMLIVHNNQIEENSNRQTIENYKKFIRKNHGGRQFKAIGYTNLKISDEGKIFNGATFKDLNYKEATEAWEELYQRSQEQSKMINEVYQKV